LLRLFARRLEMIFISRFVSDAVSKAVGRADWRRSTVLYNPVDSEAFRPLTPADVQQQRADLHLQVSDFVVGMFGRICSRKHHDTLLHALKLFRSQRPVTGLVVGRATSAQEIRLRQRLADVVKSEGLDDCVRFLAFRDDVRSLMCLSDVVVAPSVGEGFGRVVVEAASCGVPVVAARSGAIPEIFEFGRIGLLFEPERPEELADCLLWVAEHPAAAADFGLAGREVAQEFSATRYERAFGDYIGRCDR